jgi:hypothetical protein
MGVVDLLHSERGTFALITIVLATVLAIVGVFDGATWIELVKYLGLTLIASKTITTAVETVTLKKPQIPRPNGEAGGT